MPKGTVSVYDKVTKSTVVPKLLLKCRSSLEIEGQAIEELFKLTRLVTYLLGKINRIIETARAAKWNAMSFIHTSHQILIASVNIAFMQTTYSTYVYLIHHQRPFITAGSWLRVTYIASYHCRHICHTRSALSVHLSELKLCIRGQ